MNESLPRFVGLSLLDVRLVLFVSGVAQVQLLGIALGLIVMGVGSRLVHVVSATDQAQRGGKNESQDRVSHSFLHDELDDHYGDLSPGIAASKPSGCDARREWPAASRLLGKEAALPTRERSLVQQLLYSGAGGEFVKTSLTTSNQKGRVAVPLLLWVAGVPFTLVLILWLLFFRGH